MFFAVSFGISVRRKLRSLTCTKINDQMDPPHLPLSVLKPFGFWTRQFFESFLELYFYNQHGRK
jgi:hypothetical protein